MSAPGYDVIPVTGVIDGPTLNSNVLLTVARPGTVSILGCFVRVQEVVAMDTIAAVIAVLHGSTELGTLTLTDGDAVGEQLFFTPATAYLNDPYFKFATAGALKFNVKTAGTDGSAVTGAVEGYFAISQPDQ